MKFICRFVLVHFVIFACGSFAQTEQAADQSQEIKQATEKIDLTVLYVGKPGSARTKEFTGFFSKHFTKVQKENIAEFSVEKVKDADVIMLDYYGANVNDAQLPPNLKTPTIMTGWAGSTIVAEKSTSQKPLEGSGYR